VATRSWGNLRRDRILVPGSIESRRTMRLTACGSGRRKEARRAAPRTEDRDGMENDPLHRVPDGAPTPERLTQSIELRKQMEQALAALSDAERTAFVMRHWEGCGIEEIAEVLKSSSNATKNTVFRAVQKLRRALQPFVETRAQARAMGTES